MKLFFEETNDEVALPTGLVDMRGEEWYVLNVESPSGGGRGGKVRASRMGDAATRFFYPSVFGCYIAEEPRG